MKILSVRKKISLYAFLMGVQKIDGATQMFAIINFPAAATLKFGSLPGNIHYNELLSHG
jgi:hypothetical protein